MEVEKNFSMECNMELKIFMMEWKKLVSMEDRKIAFHSNPCGHTYRALTNIRPLFQSQLWGPRLRSTKAVAELFAALLHNTCSDEDRSSS